HEELLPAVSLERRRQRIAGTWVFRRGRERKDERSLSAVTLSDHRENGIELDAREHHPSLAKTGRIAVEGAEPSSRPAEMCEHEGEAREEHHALRRSEERPRTALEVAHAVDAGRKRERDGRGYRVGGKQPDVEQESDPAMHADEGTDDK